MIKVMYPVSPLTPQCHAIIERAKVILGAADFHDATSREHLQRIVNHLALEQIGQPIVLDWRP